MRLKEWATKQGIHKTTALRYFHQGLIPGAYQPVPNGTIFIPDTLVEKNESEGEKTVIYAHVSSLEQSKTDLETQADRLYRFCIANGWVVDSIIKEVGSDVNDHRPKLLALLKDKDVTRIVVEHKDRLVRFGFGYIETLCKRASIDLVVVNKSSDDITERMDNND